MLFPFHPAVSGQVPSIPPPPYFVSSPTGILLTNRYVKKLKQNLIKLLPVPVEVYLKT